MSLSVTDKADVVIDVLFRNEPREPNSVTHTGAAFEIKLNVLGITGFDPSDALMVNVYVVFVATSGSVPDIKPVELFSVTPEGSVDPLANAYVISESSVAVADTDIETCSANEPKEPDAVVHTGLALI